VPHSRNTNALCCEQDHHRRKSAVKVKTQFEPHNGL